MYIKTLGEFYKATSDTLYRGQINYKILSVKELDKIIADGLVTFKQLYPSKDRGVFEAFAIVALCVVAVAAIATIAAGTPAAGAGAVSATTGATTATATGVATGTAVTSVPLGTQIMTGIKSTATYVSAVFKKKVKEGISNVPDRLEVAAKEVVTEKATEEAMEAFGYELDARGQKIDDPAILAALKERLKREQLTYAEYLKRQANDLRKAQGLPQQKPVDWTKWVMAASPFALYYLSK